MLKTRVDELFIVHYLIYIAEDTSALNLLSHYTLI